MNKVKAIVFALLAAAFYAINVPASKFLLNHIGPTTMAALLYLGAGLGMSVVSCLGKSDKGEKLDRHDLPYTIGMILLDIAAPIFLMLGISYGTLTALLLGFVAYGLSIFLYVRAQNVIGAAKTSAYYAVAPFIGAFLSFAFLHETLTGMYLVSLLIMIAGATIVVADTLIRNHEHEHQHTYSHFHNGHIHTHTIVHSHAHNHYFAETKHGHIHSAKELESAHIAHR